MWLITNKLIVSLTVYFLGSIAHKQAYIIVQLDFFGEIDKDIM